MEKTILVIILASLLGALAVAITSIIMFYKAIDIGDAESELDFFGHDVEILESKNDYKI